MVARGLAATRERAQRLIMAGQVLVGDVPHDKAGAKVDEDSEIRLRGEDHPFVGRGGLKLDGALVDLGIPVEGAHAVDVGASTGGFTDALLQRGACCVAAVDVGTNQLAWKLRADPRVQVLENQDIRTLDSKVLRHAPDLIVVDASFISLRLVLPPIVALLPTAGRVVALVKPQFEVGRGRVGKGGVVKDDDLREEAVVGVLDLARSLGLLIQGRVDCRLAGAKAGNREVFVHWAKA